MFDSATKLSSGQSVTCSKDVSGTVNIPGATLILNGGDQKITSSVTANEVIFGGTGTKTVSSMTIGKLTVPKDVTLTGSGTLTVNGDASNSGTITGTSLYLKISGNITNSGTWNNSSTYIFWTPVSGASFYDFNITNNLSSWPAPVKPSGTSYNVGSLLTSETETINLNADVNGDGKIGLEEPVYILQVVAGIR